MAEALSMTLGKYRHYENTNPKTGYKREHLPVDFARKLADVVEACGVPREEVMALAGVPAFAHLPSPPVGAALHHSEGEPGIVEVGNVDFAAVGRFDMGISAGPGSLLNPHQEPIGYDLFRVQWLRALSTASPSRLCVVRVEGDSMAPLLNEDDWVLVDRTQTEVPPEAVYVIRIADAVFVKRLSLNYADQRVRVLSVNTGYPAQDLPPAEVEIIGRAVAVVARKL